MFSLSLSLFLSLTDLLYCVRNGFIPLFYVLTSIYFLLLLVLLAVIYHQCVKCVLYNALLKSYKAVKTYTCGTISAKTCTIRQLRVKQLRISRLIIIFQPRCCLFPSNEFADAFGQVFHIRYMRVFGVTFVNNRKRYHKA